MARRVTVAMVLALALVGFAGVPGSALTKEQACDLVTADDFETAFGVAPTRATPDGEEGVYTTCTWVVPADTGVSTAFVGINKVSKIAKKDFKANKKSPDAEKVPGIKKGFYSAEGTAGTVTFIKSGNFVNVQYLGASPEDVEAHKDALIDLSTGLYDEL